MKDEYCLELARIATESAHSVGLTNIKQEWLYAQFMHESNAMQSDLARDYFNLGGVTQTEPNDAPQPDGTCYYMKFPSYEDYATYFGRYLRYYMDGSGVQNATTLAEYITALKDSPSGAYFGDSLGNYIRGCYFRIRDLEE